MDEITSKEYEHGWTVNLEADEAPKGLTEDTVRFISAKRMNRHGCWTGDLKPIVNG